MKLRDLLTELAATVTATGTKVSAADRSLPAGTRFSPEQVAAAIRQKLIVSGYKIIQPLSIRTAGNNQYSVTGPGISLMATFDNASGRVDIFNQ
jgi:hypothetical protein